HALARRLRRRASLSSRLCRPADGAEPQRGCARRQSLRASAEKAFFAAVEIPRLLPYRNRISGARLAALSPGLSARRSETPGIRRAVRARPAARNARDATA